jgi:integrase
LAALRAAKRKERTVAQVHGVAAENLRMWAACKGYVLLDRLTLPVLDEYVATWKYASTTHRQRIDRLRQFFNFCMRRKWVTDNPASGLIKPADDSEPTMPFTLEEETRLLDAALRFHERPNFNGLWASNHLTACALMLVMRYTGLRASDAVLFEPRKITTRRVDGVAVPVYATYTEKTGEHVFCPIPPEIAAEIKSAPRLTEEHAFIPPASSGLQRDVRSIANNFYGTYLTPLGTMAGVTEVRAHRFRDTFAVRVLEKGKSLETVQKLLGHRSILTTERHYAPWCRSRQEMLIRDVMQTWHS